VELASTSVFDHPLINPGLLASDFDTQVMIEGVKAAKRFVSASPWQGYIAAPFIDSINTTTDAGIEAYARQFSTTIRHPIGTAAMSKDSDKGGVVGPQLNVKNVVGLRVVDASVFPFATGGHPQAVVYAIAERMADIIKATYDLQT